MGDKGRHEGVVRLGSFVRRVMKEIGVVAMRRDLPSYGLEAACPGCAALGVA